jgi:hypothetical protein
LEFSAIYDACVLYPFQVRDTLMVAALTRSFMLYWTNAILDECTHNLIADGRATPENMHRMVADMKELFPHSTVPLADYESLIPVMTNHPKDRHVLAAAVSRGVNVIVTRNIDDFPLASVEPYLIDVQSPDVFVRHVIDLEPGIFVQCFRERNDARRAWATRTYKPFRSDEEIARQLAFANPPMPDTSRQLLECLANPSNMARRSPERGSRPNFSAQSPTHP